MTKGRKSSHQQSWRGRALGLMGFALFIVACFVIHRELRSHSYQEIFVHLTNYSASTLLIAFLLTGLNYLIATGYDGLAVHFIGIKIQTWKFMLTAFIASVFGYNVGFPTFSGTAIRYRMYSGFGLSASDVAKIVGFNVLTIGFGILTLVGTISVLEPAVIQTHFGLPDTAARLIGMSLLLIVLFYLGWSWLGKKSVRLWRWTIRLPSWKYATTQIIIASIDWALACAILFVLMPGELPFSFFGFLVVYVLAQLSGVVSNVPGGLGVFESIVLVFCSPYISATEVLASLVAYRLIYYFLPFVLGTFLLASHEFRNKKNIFKTIFRSDQPNHPAAL